MKEMNPSDLTLLSQKLPLSKSTLSRIADGEKRVLKPLVAGEPLSAPERPQPVSEAFSIPRKGDRASVIPWKPEDGLNQTERRYLEKLRAEHAAMMETITIRIQAYRLELAPKCTYTPDFSVYYSTTNHIRFLEVKGAFIRDDALVKLKTAARLYPEHTFYLCQWKNSQWTETRMGQ
jgi:hypothetical protein